MNLSRILPLPTRRTTIYKAGGLFILSILSVFSCATPKPTPPAPAPVLPSTPTLPSADREFRAAWVATVANINWPSKPGLPAEKQKEEAIALLDLLADNNFNAVIFQVRPQADALYPSSLEPWSYYLTGEQGTAPAPFYDPLKFWVEAAHERGLELHAWLNPYRAHHTAGGEITDSSIVKKKPELALQLANGMWWLDPALKGTQDHSNAVVMDIVRRYDIDGIHFDDYFYPYPSYNDGQDFPDSLSWQAYQAAGGELSRGDWRRQAVNQFVERVYQSIKAEKPQVKFGLSPFGIWRPRNPPSIQGFDQYEQLYADARLWLNEGWVDYWTPQLYWPINQIPQSFPVLLGWWKQQNAKGRHLWPGMSIGRIKGEKGTDEVVNQIMIARGMIPDAPGHAHWSIGVLQSNDSLLQAIANGPYRKPALAPPSPWLDNTPPPAPEVDMKLEMQDNRLMAKVFPTETGQAFRWVAYFRHGGEWDYHIINSGGPHAFIPLFKVKPGVLPKERPTELPAPEAVYEPLAELYVTAVSRSGNESPASAISLPAFSYDLAPPVASLFPEPEPIVEKVPETRRANIQLGVEVLLSEQLDLIRGKRVGLITNPSAVDGQLRSTIDLLAETPGVDLAALFGPEHGVRGAEEGRILLEGEPDPRTGVPVYSLYGDGYAPKAEWLEKIDVLLFDIQGVGSAWYTFKYTMSYAMEACARADIPFVVLDRPNPLGGEVVEGPYLNLGSIFRHRLPLRHGMTYGELARMWNETEGFGAELTVVPMKGWKRNMLWHETGLFWVMPSPNMGTFETAVVYPGQCLFERTNLSEGRGTTKPFLLTGASWIDAEKAAQDLNSRNIPGAVFRPAYFIPNIDPARANPRGKPWNELCGGVEIMLTDPAAYRSVATALHIFDAYRKAGSGTLQWAPPEVIRRLLERPGVMVEELVEDCQKEVEGFMRVRERFLMYR
ncbi:MAG: DUF1343 domain-containing protein [Lewinellaceae bacterium]|nr:DUF1343 domain-containing protein [Phaeodactylibacter sp.]MCB9035762.1 DUF1343 domain-containing protein [Lewinellaceae bacterium]